LLNNFYLYAKGHARKDNPVHNEVSTINTFPRNEKTPSVRHCGLRSHIFTIYVYGAICMSLAPLEKGALLLDILTIHSLSEGVISADL